MKYKKLILFLVISQLYACKFFGQSDQSSSVKSNNLNDQDSALYLQKCEERLGPVPNLNCLQGSSITRTLKGKKSPLIGEGQYHNNDCDNPSYLALLNSAMSPDEVLPVCPVDQYVGRLSNSTSDWLYSCVNFFKMSDGNEIEKFQSISMYGYNRKTGETCWFESTDMEAGVSPVVRKEDWSIAAIRENPCIECHDDDPFIGSPPVVNVRQKDGFVLPRGRGLMPFKNVAVDLIGGEWSKPVKYLHSKKAAECTSCHRIASNQTCKNFARLSHGMTAKVYDLNDFSTPLNAHNPAWMPPGGRDSKTDAALKEISRCCESLNDPSCDWREL